jgi:hypothetical protein
VTLEQFERRAHQLFDSIPAELRGGVEYLVVERRAVRHPDHPGVFTLGECATGELDLGDDLAVPTRSAIHLYWGSFRALAREQDDFDWEGELWETLTHELRHHRESGAGEDALEDFDVAAEENFRRREGQPFDPLFFRMGEDAGGGWRDVDGDRFLEVEAAAAPAGAPLLVELDGRTLEVDVPAAAADVHFLYLEDADAELDTAVVLVRRRSAWQRLLAALGGGAPTAAETSAPWRLRG